jgi:hypothetical protein
MKTLLLVGVDMIHRLTDPNDPAAFYGATEQVPLSWRPAVCAAAEVRTAGRAGLATVSKITGLARSTIDRGKADLDAQPLPKGRVRRAGGGRRPLCENDPGLIPALKRFSYSSECPSRHQRGA